MPRSKYVFLSHLKEDKPFARLLEKMMVERGVQVFVDDNFKVGDYWSETLRREMEKASALVLVLPSAGLSMRNFLWFEAGAAKALGKRVLAVLPPRARLDGLPTDIADVLLLDAGERPLESIADTLVQAIPDHAEERLHAS